MLGGDETRSSSRTDYQVELPEYIFRYVATDFEFEGS